MYCGRTENLVLLAKLKFTQQRIALAVKLDILREMPVSVEENCTQKKETSGTTNKKIHTVACLLVKMANKLTQIES